MLSKYFSHGNYEKETGTKERELHYINTPTGLSAIIERKNGTDTVFYVHTDRLGLTIRCDHGRGRGGI